MSVAMVASPAQVQAPLVQMQVRGVPAMSYLGRIVWAETLPDMSAGEHIANCLLSKSRPAVSSKCLVPSTNGNPRTAHHRDKLKLAPLN